MIEREAFVGDRRARWDRLEHLLGTSRRDAREWVELSSLYRSVAADLARARTHGLPADILVYLDHLAGRAHNQVYGTALGGAPGLLGVVVDEFPREVRRQWRVVGIAAALFALPFLAALVACMVQPEVAEIFVPRGALVQAEASYLDPDPGRSAGQDVGMAGFYVWNNVGIAFRCFATGALFGLGTVFYLVSNGLSIGALAGYLGAMGMGGNLLAFTAGHSAWELTGVVIAGAAGLKMGWALVATGGRSRVASLGEVAPVLVRLLVGASALLLMAALIEGFWSAGPFPPPLKIAFGVVQVGVVAAWLVLGGRRGAP